MGLSDVMSLGGWGVGGVRGCFKSLENGLENARGEKGKEGQNRRVVWGGGGGGTGWQRSSPVAVRSTPLSSFPVHLCPRYPSPPKNPPKTGAQRRFRVTHGPSHGKPTGEGVVVGEKGVGGEMGTKEGFKGNVGFS